jgi:hypothetical protein
MELALEVIKPTFQRSPLKNILIHAKGILGALSEVMVGQSAVLIPPGDISANHQLYNIALFYVYNIYLPRLPNSSN